MQDSYPQSNHRQQSFPAFQPEFRCVLHNVLLTTQPRAYAHENGRPYSSKRHRCTLNQHARNDRRFCRKPQRDEQRHTDSGRSTKARRSFNERAKQPRDDNDLHTAIRRDVRETLPNDSQPTTLGQHVQQQNRTENDVQQRTSDHQSI